MNIKEIIKELGKGAILTHFLAKTKHDFNEFVLQIDQKQKIITKNQFNKLKEDKNITFVGSEGNFLNIYTYNGTKRKS